jgi:DNA polymerase elongation subunit (family B)
MLGINRPGYDIFDGQMYINEDNIDLYCEPYQITYEYSPKTDLPDYDTLSKIYLDIETTGLDPNDPLTRVLMVGIMHSDGRIKIITNQDERSILIETIDYLTKNQPDVLIGHNHIKFDLPFLSTRAKLFNLSFPWRLSDKTKNITSASVFGKPIEYTPIYWSGTNIIDTYHQIAIWDKSAAKLERYDLKSSVIALKLREDRRLELGVDEITECWENNDLSTIQTYLEYDLADTQLLADFLLPTVYYQLAYVPDISFQNIAVANAVKLQKIYENLYTPKKDVIADEKRGYEGGISELLYRGLHHNVAKIDVNSMYPSIMLRYGICSIKDNEQRSLSVLKTMVEERLKFKKLAKVGDKSADHRQNALKILINSQYGFLGVGYYSYNDMEAAALVTAIGRKILTLMVEIIEEEGGIVIGVDTDGIIYSHPTNTTKVYEVVASKLPSGITIDLEFEKTGIYAPKAKNYVLVSSDGKVSCKGLYRKRNRYPLQNNHPLEIIRRYFTEGKESATEYHQDMIIALKTRSIDISELTINRRIGKAEKSIVELGLGKCGDKVSYWYSEYAPIGKSGKKLKSKKQETVTNLYWAEYYMDKANEEYKQIFSPGENKRANY